MSFWKKLIGMDNDCLHRDKNGTCLDKQKGNMFRVTCSYCYAVGNSFIKEGDWA